MPNTAFGLYYDEDEDGRYGPVGSLALTFIILKMVIAIAIISIAARPVEQKSMTLLLGFTLLSEILSGLKMVLGRSCLSAREWNVRRSL